MKKQAQRAQMTWPGFLRGRYRSGPICWLSHLLMKTTCGSFSESPLNCQPESYLSIRENTKKVLPYSIHWPVSPNHSLVQLGFEFELLSLFQSYSQFYHCIVVESKDGTGGIKELKDREIKFELVIWVVRTKSWLKLWTYMCLLS